MLFAIRMLDDSELTLAAVSYCQNCLPRWRVQRYTDCGAPAAIVAYYQHAIAVIFDCGGRAFRWPEVDKCDSAGPGRLVRTGICTNQQQDEQQSSHLGRWSS